MEIKEAQIHFLLNYKMSTSNPCAWALMFQSKSNTITKYKTQLDCRHTTVGKLHKASCTDVALYVPGLLQGRKLQHYIS